STMRCRSICARDWMLRGTAHVATFCFSMAMSKVSQRSVRPLSQFYFSAVKGTRATRAFSEDARLDIKTSLADVAHRHRRNSSADSRRTPPQPGRTFGMRALWRALRGNLRGLFQIQGQSPYFLTLADACKTIVSLMPRTARIVAPGLAHHITQRGNN